MADRPARQRQTIRDTYGRHHRAEDTPLHPALRLALDLRAAIHRALNEQTGGQS